MSSFTKVISAIPPASLAISDLTVTPGTLSAIKYSANACSKTLPLSTNVLLANCSFLILLNKLPILLLNLTASKLVNSFWAFWAVSVKLFSLASTTASILSEFSKNSFIALSDFLLAIRFIKALRLSLRVL